MHEIEKTGKETGEKGSMDRIPYGSSCDYQPDLLYPDVKYDLTCNGKWYDHRGDLKWGNSTLWGYRGRRYCIIEKWGQYPSTYKYTEYQRVWMGIYQSLLWWYRIRSIIRCIRDNNASWWSWGCRIQDQYGTDWFLQSIPWGQTGSWYVGAGLDIAGTDSRFLQRWADQQCKRVFGYSNGSNYPCWWWGSRPSNWCKQSNLHR